jgi:hypothetical protein
MVAQMWFGIPTKHAQWVPCPQIDSTITRNRYLERIQFENGGGDLRRSNQFQMEYGINVIGEAHEVEGIDAYAKFASGFYGSDLLYMAHPANFETNLFASAWASPGLIEEGWKSLTTSTPTFVNTGANTKNQPSRSAVFIISAAALVPTKKFTIMIPPTHVLNLGATGSATGTGVVRVRPILTNGSYTTESSLTFLGVDSSARTNATFSGATYSAVEIYLTRTATTASVITLTSMIAQLYKIGVTPSLPALHRAGEGSTGLQFADDAITETYSYMYPPQKALSTILVEVEAWR